MKGPTLVLRGANAEIQATSLSWSETLLATGNSDGEVWIWDLQNSCRPLCRHKCHSAEEGILALHILPVSTHKPQNNTGTHRSGGHVRDGRAINEGNDKAEPPLSLLLTQVRDDALTAGYLYSYLNNVSPTIFSIYS